MARPSITTLSIATLSIVTLLLLMVVVLGVSSPAAMADTYQLQQAGQLQPTEQLQQTEQLKQYPKQSSQQLEQRKETPNQITLPQHEVAVPADREAVNASVIGNNIPDACHHCDCRGDSCAVCYPKGCYSGCVKCRTQKSGALDTPNITLPPPPQLDSTPR